MGEGPYGRFRPADVELAQAGLECPFRARVRLFRNESTTYLRAGQFLVRQRVYHALQLWLHVFFGFGLGDKGLPQDVLEHPRQVGKLDVNHLRDAPTAVSELPGSRETAVLRRES